MNRKELIQKLNTSDLPSHLNKLQQAIILRMTSDLTRNFAQEEPDLKSEDVMILNQAGPALAVMAVEHATRQAIENGYFQDLKPKLNGSSVYNVKLIQNFQGDGYEYWSESVRSWLLPRTAYWDFDLIVDPRHRIDRDCGHPRYISPFMYRWMYDRDDTAGKVVDIYPDESWAADPTVTDTESEHEITPFKERWDYLCNRKSLMQTMYRADKLCGVGRFGLLVFGLDDGKNMDQEVVGVKDFDPDNPTERSEIGINWMRPLDEYLCYGQQFDTDPNSKRYGLPEYYNVILTDMGLDFAPITTTGTVTYQRIHWTRCIHLADNLQTGPYAGKPRQKGVFDRLLDLRKLKSSSPEMYYQGAFPGISFELDPRVSAADELDYDEDDFKTQLEQYTSGFSRFLHLVGLKANSLAPQVVDPKGHIRVQDEAIAAHMNVPYRIWKGSEEARLASAQDKLAWNRRLGKRLRTFVEPCLIRPVAERLMAYGALPIPKNKRFWVGWGDLNTVTDEDKANLALKWTQAMSQYVATGIIHLMSPMDFCTIIMGLSPAQARMVVKSTNMETLKGVDPSKPPVPSGGVNAAKSGGDGEKSKTPKRDSGNKKTDGMKG